jgi:hypothetical protein
MAVTWGSMESNAEMERACYEQAREELQGQCRSGLEFIRRTLARAQEIKEEKNGVNHNSR